MRTQSSDQKIREMIKIKEQAEQVKQALEAIIKTND
jgi:hypothetical protein